MGGGGVAITVGIVFRAAGFSFIGRAMMVPEKIARRFGVLRAYCGRWRWIYIFGTRSSGVFRVPICSHSANADACVCITYCRCLVILNGCSFVCNSTSDLEGRVRPCFRRAIN